MCRTQCVLVLVALYVGLAHSWDIAVSVGDQLIFFTDGTKTNTVNLISHNLTAIAYDEVRNMILYVDKQSDSDAICGYNLHSMENKCFIKRNSSNIHRIAFDPVTDTLFFTDTNERSINWVSLKPGSNNNVNLLFTMDDRTPSDIAVDSCRGYIYWSNTNNIENEDYLERALFNGSESEVISRWLPIFSLAIDPQTQKIHYLYGCETCSYEFLGGAELDGRHRYKNFTHIHNTHLPAPQELTVSKDYLYWMNSSESYRTVWHLPKNASTDAEPKEIIKFYNESPFGIAAKYKIKDQIHGLQDCEVLSSLVPQSAVTNSFCVHGIKVGETSVCKCTPGYIGDRCDVSVCENYCLQGNCSFNDEGLPKCRCNAGYSGERCEVYACHGYCLNNGDCSLNEEDEPFCQCVGNHEGTRCEAAKDVTINNIPTYESAKRNLTLADLLLSWRKPTSKIFVTVEV